MVVGLFLGCETQEDFVHEQGKKISTETVSFKTLLSKVQNKKMEANQRIWFEQKSKGNFYRTDEDFIKDIDTTTVEKMVVDGKESYTLRILTQDDTENRFYNMVVSEKEDAFYTSYIKYEGIDNTKEGVEKVMNGVKTSVDENGEEFSENNPSSGNRDDCINIIPTWLCDQQCFHSPEDSGTVCPAGTSWQIIGYTIETVPCSGTNPGYTPNHTSTNPSPTESNNNYPTSSQPHGGSSGSYYGNPVYTIPVLPKKTAKEIKLAFLAFLNDTNNPHPNELAWWNTTTNPNINIIKNEILAYLTANQTYAVEEQTPFDFALQIINADINDILLTPSPFFKFPINSNYQNLYPNFTEYVKNKIPLLKQNNFIINKLVQYSELSISKVKRDLQWGEGPTIKIVQLNGFCETCDDDTYGLFNSDDPNSIYVDIDIVNLIESSPNSPEGDSLAFLLGVSILHEYVHLGDYVDGIDQPGEEGLLFEQATYGESIWINNAGDVLIKNNP